MFQHLFYTNIDRRTKTKLQITIVSHVHAGVKCLVVSPSVLERDRQRNRKTDRQTETDRQTDRHRERERQRERETERQTETDRDRQIYRQTQREREPGYILITHVLRVRTYL